MTEGRSEGPVLFCYDGSEGSRDALRAAGELLEPGVELVVVTVWEPIAIRLALSGAFAAATLNGGELDEKELSFAREAAEDGARRATEHGYKATSLTAESTEGIARAIITVAEDLGARLIVCGRRGRGPIRTALLGSVSHALAAHAHRPVLIVPEKE